jgi:ankyrin repeat protein
MSAVASANIDEATTLIMAKMLIESGADVDSRDNSGTTPLMEAAVAAHLDVATLLFEKGADVNAISTDGRTALMGAVGADGDNDLKSLYMVQFLLDLGANVNAMDNSGYTPLAIAQQWDAYRIAEILLEYGADKESAARAPAPEVSKEQLDRLDRVLRGDFRQD